ncbi:helix-turn-helix domain-containing protein [Pedobacter sp. LMG 31464]|uniref:Helix-turn-helix domain-containing protein n=1 Tax=Pedobacter planticolens TaxID=2679964 RepID=A0A923DZI1_9SPHI|nr:helix-turn-helix transcriptional regulator [Pedobacter planticolens]MBB2145308.1 helix-turn-helix domain-containing protein [Pedobacter planticolens]
MKNDIPIYDIQNLKAYKHDGIFVSRFGHYSKQHEHLHSAHRHTFFHLVFFTEGSGNQHIDFKEFDVKPGLIYFMIPGQVHSWSFDTEPDGYIINFSADYLSSFLLKPDYLETFSFFNGQPDSQVIELPAEVQHTITSIFEDILKEGQIEQPVNDDLVKTQLIRLFIEVARTNSATQKTNSYNHTLLKNFRNLIEKNYAQLRLPKQYAELLYITPNHLNALCNDFLGISAGALIRDRVVLEAKRLLINLDLRVSEIADKLNFADQSYFIKFFKKYEGITPEKFRKLNTTQNGN